MANDNKDSRASSSGPGILARLAHGFEDWYYRHKKHGHNNILVVTIAILLVVMVTLIILKQNDHVMIEGRPRWNKPLNFAQSLTIYLVSILWLLDYLGDSVYWKKIISWGVSVCVLVGVVCITMQAARGTTSHFNTSTTFDAVISMLLDIVDTLNLLFVIPLLVFAFQSKYELSRPINWGIAYGIIFFFVGSAIGGLMIALKTHSVDVPTGGPGIPFLNWSTKGGDLRVSHFLGIHSLQGMVLVGWLCNRPKSFSMKTKLILVTLVAAAILTLIVYTFIEAMEGIAFIS